MNGALFEQQLYWAQRMRDEIWRFNGLVLVAENNSADYHRNCLDSHFGWVVQQYVIREPCEEFNGCAVRWQLQPSITRLYNIPWRVSFTREELSSFQAPLSLSEDQANKKRSLGLTSCKGAPYFCDIEGKQNPVQR